MIRPRPRRTRVPIKLDAAIQRIFWDRRDRALSTFYAEEPSRFLS